MEGALSKNAFSVSEITSLIRGILREGFHSLSVRGEVSGFRTASSGHWYFTLKDEKAQLSVVMFRSANAILPFRPADGDVVEVTGDIDVYEARGTYQLIAHTMRQGGLGEILARLQKRKEYYQSLGWFDAEGKPQLPRLPGNIGIVTAPTGAAIRDMLDTTARRAPWVDISIYPTLVQGAEAPAAIAAAIAQADELGLCDVLIVGRGGGSMEDLLPFSDDMVVKAIHECSIPVVSAVGHEVDWALSDYVASRRAITPTDAAMIVTEGWFQVRQALPQLMEDARQALLRREERSRAALPGQGILKALMLSHLSRVSPYSRDAAEGIMRRHLDSATLRLSYAFEGASEAMGRKAEDAGAEISRLMDEATRHMQQVLMEKATKLQGRDRDLLMRQRLGSYEKRLAALSASLEALDPGAVLSRGYAIVSDVDGHVVKDAGKLAPGAEVDIRLAQGSLAAKVIGGRKK